MFTYELCLDFNTKDTYILCNETGKRLWVDNDYIEKYPSINQASWQEQQEFIEKYLAINCKENLDFLQEV